MRKFRSAKISDFGKSGSCSIFLLYGAIFGTYFLKTAAHVTCFGVLCFWYNALSASCSIFLLYGAIFGTYFLFFRISGFIKAPGVPPWITSGPPTSSGGLFWSFPTTIYFPRHAKKAFQPRYTFLGTRRKLSNHDILS